MSAESIAEITKLIGLPQKCSEEFSQFIFQTACVKLIFSKILGYGVVGGSLLYKLPQIFSILRAKSVMGLSILSIFLELLGVTINLSYNFRKGFPFSTWGEYVFMLIQTIIILFLVDYYTGSFRFIQWVLYFGLTYALFTPSILQEENLKIAQQLAVPIFAFSRATQIFVNFKNGNVGTLSFATIFMQWGGSASRVFTTIQEVDDLTILASFLIGFSLNTILLLQMIFMKKGEQVKEEKKKK
eukprot:gene1193-10707_t